MVPRKILSFGYALNGLKIVWREEAHFKFHVSAGCIALLASWAFRVTPTEFLIVLTMIAMVITAEIINTALEELCDKFTQDRDPHIAKIKDISAAAVFVASCTSFIIGAIIFIPHLLKIL